MKDPCVHDEPSDPRVRRTRKLLQDAFRTLLNGMHYSEISVQAIAEKATVNRATFYAHFLDKDDIAQSVLRRDLREHMFGKFKQKPDPTHENLVRVASAFFEFVTRMSRSCSEAASDLQGPAGSALQSELYLMVLGLLSDGNGNGPASTDSQQTRASCISWSIYGGAMDWMRGPRVKDIDTLCKEILTVFVAPGKVWR